MDEESSEETKPPYLPFQTFLNYLGELGSKPLAPKIDRSMMKNKSGSDQSSLIGALKFFSFIDDDQVVLDTLREFVPMSEDDRKVALTARLHDLYPEAFKVSDQHGSEKALLDCFEQAYGYTGDTRRKAVTFFLHASRWCGIQMSAHFPTTRMGAGRVASGSVKRIPSKKGTVKRNPPQVKTKSPTPSSTAESVEAIFGELGSAVLTLNVPLLSLPESTLTGLLKVVNDLRALSYDEMDEDDLYDEEESP